MIHELVSLTWQLPENNAGVRAFERIPAIAPNATLENNSYFDFQDKLEPIKLKFKSAVSPNSSFLDTSLFIDYVVPAPPPLPVLDGVGDRSKTMLKYLLISFAFSPLSF